MRILILAHGFPPGEPGVWTGAFAAALARRHSVWVYTRGADPTRPEFTQWEERVGHVTVRRVNHTRFDPFAGFDGFRVPPIDRQGLAFAEEIGVDVVHVEHTYGLSASLPSLLSARGIPTVVSLYDFWTVCQRIYLLRDDGAACAGPSPAEDCVTCVEAPHEFRQSPRPPAPAWRLPLLEHRQVLMREAVAGAAAVTACSASLRDRIAPLLDLPLDRIRVVPLGVPPLPRLPRVPAPDGRLRVRYLGAVAPHKGVITLAEAAARLADRPVAVHLHGWVHPTIRARLDAISPGLHWHGAYGRDQLPGILAETDVLVIPSLAAETFSFVTREAALADVPVIGSRIGAIAEYLEHEVSGLLVTPGSVDDLVDAIERLRLDEPLRRRLATTHGPLRSIDDYTAEMEAMLVDAARTAAERRTR